MVNVNKARIETIPARAGKASSGKMSPDHPGSVGQVRFRLLIL